MKELKCMKTHYYCVSDNCQWVGHLKPHERRCPKCGAKVWKEGASTLVHKPLPACVITQPPLTNSGTLSQEGGWPEDAAREILCPDGEKLEGYEEADIVEVGKIIRKHWSASRMPRADSR